MKYRGEVKNGVVVLDSPNGLTDGTIVEVEAVPRRAPGEPRRGSAAALLRHAGKWAGDPAELDRLLEHLRQMKQAEVEATKAVLFPKGTRRKTKKRASTPQRKRRR